MVRMGAVWDRTVEVFAGRGGTIARVALLTVFLPTVVQAAVSLATGTGQGSRLIGGIVGLGAFLVTLFGTLAITALASDPTTDEPRGYLIARDTLPSAVGVLVVIGLVLTVLIVPGAGLIAASGFDLRAAELNLPQPAVSPGPLLGAFGYFVVLSIVLLWAAARLAPLYAVLVNERPGLRAIGRTFALTRGLALRIVGVLILYAIVVTVAWWATTVVVGTVARLLLGSERIGLAGFVVAIANGAVLTGFGLLQPVFTARLYAAIREAREGTAPLA